MAFSLISYTEYHRYRAVKMFQYTNFYLSLRKHKHWISKKDGKRNIIFYIFLYLPAYSSTHNAINLNWIEESLEGFTDKIARALHHFAVFYEGLQKRERIASTHVFKSSSGTTPHTCGGWDVIAKRGKSFAMTPSSSAVHWS